MRLRSSFALYALVLGGLACGGDGGTGPSAPSYDAIGGSYSGAMAGTSQGVAMNALFTLTINQSGGSLSGTYGMAGTLSEPGTTVDVAGSGTLTGTIAAGNNPSVNLTVRSGTCPSYTAQFSGAYDSANDRITITGPVEIFDVCGNVVLTYPMTIILNR